MRAGRSVAAASRRTSTLFSGVTRADVSFFDSTGRPGWWMQRSPFREKSRVAVAAVVRTNSDYTAKSGQFPASVSSASHFDTMSGTAP